jgi:hypothetical protein
LATRHAPRQLILGVFASADGAGAVRGALRESARREVIGIVSLATVKRDGDGRLELLQARSGPDRDDDHDPLLAILEVILGRPCDAATCSRLCTLAEALPPRSSALAALIEHRWLDDIRALMEEAGPDAVAAALSAEMTSALGSGRDLLVTAGATGWPGGRFAGGVRAGT